MRQFRSCSHGGNPLRGAQPRQKSINFSLSHNLCCTLSRISASQAEEEALSSTSLQLRNLFTSQSRLWIRGDEKAKASKAFVFPSPHISASYSFMTKTHSRSDSLRPCWCMASPSDAAVPESLPPPISAWLCPHHDYKACRLWRLGLGFIIYITTLIHSR